MIEGSEDYWKYRWRKLHKNKEISYRGIDQHHPKRGWTLKPNLKNKLHYAATISSNSKGIRGIREEFTEKKVLFLGDSFCFGEGVDDNETIPAFFEKKLKNIQTINLGIHGYGIDQQYLYLKETISKYKPLLTCFIITDNDFRRNLMNFRDYAKPKFIIQNNQVILERTFIPKPDQLKIKKIPIFHLFFETLQHFLIYYGFIKIKENIEINNYILDQIKKLTDNHKSELIFIYLNDVRRGFWYRTYIDHYFINYFKKRNIKFLYLEKIFGRKKLREMFDTLSGHLSTKGNELVADKLSKLIKQKGMLK